MKKIYQRPDAEVVNLAALSRIVLIEEEPDKRGNDDFDFQFSSGFDNDRT